MKKKRKALEFKSDIKPAAQAPKAKPPEPAKPLVGLVCRACECRHFEVVYTRPAFGGRIMRCRACRNCGKRIQTYEVPVRESGG